MAKLKLQYAEGKFWELKAPSFSFQRPQGINETLLNLVRWFQFGSLALFAAMIPVIEAAADGRVALGKWLIVLAAMQLGCIAASILLTGTKFTVDPPLFVQILVFALLVITAFLFASNNPRNTFGVPEMLYLGGLMIMSSIALYYSTAFVITSKLKLKAFLAAFASAGFFALVVNAFQFGTWEKTAAVAALFLPVFIIYSFWGGSNLWRVTSVVGAIFALYAIIARGTVISFWFLALTAIVTSIILFVNVKYTKTKLSWPALQKDQSQYLAGKIGFGELVTNQRAIYTIIFIAFILIAAGLMAYQRKLDLLATVNTLLAEYQRAFARIAVWPTVASGVGSGAGAGITTWRTALVFNGLLGLAGYLILTLSASWFGLKTLTNSFSGGKLDNVAGIILAPIAIAIPLWGFLLQIPLSVMLLWWLSMGLLVADSLVSTRSDNWQVKVYAPKLLKRIPSNYIQIIPAVLSVLVFLAVAYIAAQLITQVI